jgi:hypothetical protein
LFVCCLFVCKGYFLSLRFCYKKDCTLTEPKLRPSFPEILNRLDEIFETYNSDVREKIIANQNDKGEYEE